MENGFTDKDDTIVKETVRRYLAPIKESGADTLILGCTHYPHLAAAISSYLGEKTRLISSGAAEYARELMTRTGLLSDRTEEGMLTCYTTDSAELFEANAGRFLDSGISCTVNKISVEELYI